MPRERARGLSGDSLPVHWTVDEYRLNPGAEFFRSCPRPRLIALPPENVDLLLAHREVLQDRQRSPQGGLQRGSHLWMHDSLIALKSIRGFPSRIIPGLHSPTGHSTLALHPPAAGMTRV